MKISRLSAVACAAVASLSLGLSACAANEGGGGDAAPAGGASSGAANLTGTLSGVGASSAATAQETWAAAFQTANPDVTVNYSPDGSGAGRDAFAGGGADFAGSDRALTAEEASAASLGSSRCADGSAAIDLPIYVSPIAVIYQLDGVDDLELDAETLAGIFKGDIKTWDDAKIQALNEGTELPGSNITAVHRADDSGTTENFTDYLHTLAPKVWDAEPDGEWPYPGGEAAPQTSGVVDAVSNGNGTIGYADASKAGDLGVAQIQVGEKYLGPTAEAAAAVVDASPRDTEGRSANDIVVTLDRKAEGDVYPVVLLSYAIACEKYEDPAVAAKVKGYLSYVASAEGQQDAVA
ncbi:MAG: Phosphate ABC transporter, periplasmic phosphate-binding protein PstS, partial [uncultured Friedmanniella sp.]